MIKLLTATKLNLVCVSIVSCRKSIGVAVLSEVLEWKYSSKMHPTCPEL